MQLLHRGFLTFCHCHSSICQFCARSYVIAIVNSEPPTFLPFSLMWHTRWTCQCGSELESSNLAQEMAYLPLCFSLNLLTRGSLVSIFSNLQPSPCRERKRGPPTAWGASAADALTLFVHLSMSLPPQSHQTAWAHPQPMRPAPWEVPPFSPCMVMAAGWRTCWLVGPTRRVSWERSERVNRLFSVPS